MTGTSPSPSAAAIAANEKLNERRRQVAAAEGRRGLVSVGHQAGAMAEFFRAQADELGFDLDAPPAPKTASEPSTSEEAARVQLRARLILANVPEHHAELIAGDVHGGQPLKRRDAMRKAEDFERSGRILAVLSGLGGRGKTLAAGWLMRRVESAMISAPILVSDGWNRTYEGPSELTRLDRRRLLRVPILVIDDYGQEPWKARQDVADTMDAIIRERCHRCRTTIITTNLEDAAFLKRLGDRKDSFASRMSEHGRWYQIEDLDLRRNAA